MAIDVKYAVKYKILRLNMRKAKRRFAPQGKFPRTGDMYTVMFSVEGLPIYLHPLLTDPVGFLRSVGIKVKN